jgi:mono/diheme cytochrome c family protein
MRLEPGVRGALAGIALLVFAVGNAAAETPVERGAYLVTTIGSCGNCHTPKDAAGRAVAGKELTGGFEFDDEVGHVIGPNITPDQKTGIGDWTEAQIVTALRDGTRPGGTIIGPPMPIPVYSKLSDNDAAAIAAYLRSLQPASHAVARTRYKIPLPPSYGPPVTHVEEPVRSDKVAYGGYLATFGHCVLCHTAPGGGRPFDMSHAFAGGRNLPDATRPGAKVVSRNITSDPDQGIGKWSDEQIKNAIVAGVRPDGSKLVRTMPFDWYAKMTPADLDAIVAFLRTVPPMKTP